MTIARVGGHPILREGEWREAKMRPRRLTFRPVLLGVVFALVVVLSGCRKSAITYTNEGGLPLARICLFVELSKPFPDFDDVNQVQWSEPYGVPDVIEMTDQAGAHWKLCWDLAPDEYIGPGETFKQAVKLPGGIKIKHADKWDVVPSGSRADTSIQTPGIGLAMKIHAVDGLVLEVVLGTQKLGSLLVEELRWATTNEDLPFENLLPGDPLLEALPWEDVTSDVPFDLAPGSEPKVFDLPDVILTSMGRVLLRASTYSPASGDRQGYIADGPINRVPAVSQWGMVAMTLLVLTAGTLVLRGRRVAPASL